MPLLLQTCHSRSARINPERLAPALSTTAFYRFHSAHSDPDAPRAILAESSRTRRQAPEDSNSLYWTDTLAPSLREYAAQIEDYLDESKQNPFRTRNRDRIKRALIDWAGDKNFSLLSRLLEQFALSKQIELTDRQQAELGEEALRKFATRHALTGSKKRPTKTRAKREA